MNRLNRLFERVKNSASYNKKAARAALSADLRILIANSGKTHADVAATLKISPPTLSRKLSGSSNLTIDSIGEIARALGMDFDVVFREAEEPRALQPWTRRAADESNEADIKCTVAQLVEDIEYLKTALRQTHRAKCFAPPNLLNFDAIRTQAACNQHNYDPLVLSVA